METKNLMVEKPTQRWEDLTWTDKQGFACNTEGCPRGATTGLKEEGRGYVDVRCDDCVVLERYRKQMEVEDDN